MSPMLQRQASEITRIKEDQTRWTAYLRHYEQYAQSYAHRPPSRRCSATRNMLKELRMMTWENTPEDWARLHATENYIR